MDASGAARRALEDLDVAGARRLWATLCPHLPQPADDKQALMIVHRARTQAESIPVSLRAYSHAWLLDRGLPSGLPDHLRPRAERMYPRIVEGVGIAVKARNEANKEHAAAVQKAMSDAVAECYADGNTDVLFIKKRMAEARRRAQSL